MSVKSRERELKRRIASGELRPLSYPEIAVKLQKLSTEREEWAGIPMMLNDFELTLEPKYPYQLTKKKTEADEPSHYEVVNSWWNEKLATTTQIILDTKTGKRFAHHVIGANKLTMLINTLGASQGWVLEAEMKAHEKLKALVTNHAFRCYLLTGTFLEQSKRSGVYYLFRKLRPTIAMSAVKGQMRGLCALCLHPIGYYQGAWSGAMVPSDDVISHLVMMRGDEHYFWRCANQHPLHYRQAGI